MAHHGPAPARGSLRRMSMRRGSLALASAVLACGVALGWVAPDAGPAGPAAPDSPAGTMAAAAARFLASLPADLRAKAALPFESPARRDWHYVPRTRAGVEFTELSDAQRIAARDLLRSALSPQGTAKVEEIMLLEVILNEVERGTGPRRDPLAYSIAVFGTPGTAPWGWKIEGHHVSLNFSDVAAAPGGAAATAVTPAFLGANPAEVRTGPRAGVRVLAAEEDLARALLASLSAEQRASAVLGDRAPADILAVPGRALDQVDGAGLAAAGMTDAQRAQVEQLIAVFAGNLRRDLADAELARIRAAGLGNVRFAWMGGAQLGQGHYWRLSGPTFVIECDNTQNDANHVHTVWRDRGRDFGRDALAEHVRGEVPAAR